MKKKITLLILLVFSFTLVACTKVELKDGKELVVSTEKSKVTIDELYTKMKERYALNIMLEMIDNNLLSDLYKDSKAEKEFVDSQLEQLKYYYSSMMENTGQYRSFEDFLANAYGFQSEAAVIEHFTLTYKKEEAAKDYGKSIISEKEIKEYYEKETIGDMKASHILLIPDYKESDDEETKNKAKEETKNLAAEIIKQLNEGAKFDELAKKHSKDGSASKGGDLGWFKQGEMTKVFEDAVVALKTNDFTKEAVESEFGYHIILKTGQKAKTKLSNVRDDIVSKLADKKKEADPKLQEKALINLRKKYGIDIKDKELSRQYKAYVSRIQD